MTRPARLAAAAAALAIVAVGAVALRPDGPPQAAALDGVSLFRTKGCATCHDGPDGRSPIGEGPSLAAVSAWAGDRVDGLSAEAYVEQSMRNPSAFISPLRAGASMPLLQLSDAEVDALVAYLLASPAG